MAITDYGYKRQITIDHTVVDATETDYPAMVKLYQDDTAPTWSSSGSYSENDVVVYNNQYFRKTSTVTNKEPFVDTDWNLDWTYLGEHLDFSLVRNDGFDFRFYASDETTELDYERELFDTNQAVFHVRIPSVSSSADTDYYCYYGYASATDGENATGVWDSNFVMVQHMGNSLVDSTINGNDGTNYGSTVVDGLNGKARSFDGVNDYFDVNNMSFNEDLTIKTLVNLKSMSSDYYNGIYYIDDNVKSDRLRMFEYATATKLNVHNEIGSNDYYLEDTSLSINEFVNYTTTKNSSNGEFSLWDNGVKIDTATTTGTGDYPTLIRFMATPSHYLDHFQQGTIDEVRISNTARDSWIKMDDYNLRTWSLQSVGVEEETGVIVEPNTITSNTVVNNVTISVGSVTLQPNTITDNTTVSNVNIYATYTLIPDSILSQTIVNNIRMFYWRYEESVSNAWTNESEVSESIWRKEDEASSIWTKKP